MFKKKCEADGSAKEINHILWDVISLHETEVVPIDTWLNQLKETEVKTPGSMGAVT
jgi:hypothetical protein